MRNKYKTKRFMIQNFLYSNILFERIKFYHIKKSLRCFLRFEKSFNKKSIEKTKVKRLQPYSKSSFNVLKGKGSV